MTIPHLTNRDEPNRLGGSAKKEPSRGWASEWEGGGGASGEARGANGTRELGGERRKLHGAVLATRKKASMNSRIRRQQDNTRTKDCR